MYIRVEAVLATADNININSNSKASAHKQLAIIHEGLPNLEKAISVRSSSCLGALFGNPQQEPSQGNEKDKGVDGDVTFASVSTSDMIHTPL